MLSLLHEAGSPLVSSPEPGRGSTIPRRVYLHPGQLFASREPSAVTTILGSCVSVCLWDPSSGIGGMNHFLLPHGPEPADRRSSQRFGDAATAALIAEIVALGGRKSLLTAKVFGGACTAEAFVKGPIRHLGPRNVERAFAVLHREGIPVEAHHTEGRRGRKVIFHTNDGSAWVKEL
ncbi:MAG TPA: chemotaxis protein CheD [Vicinamibacteria bacterium]|nr:chemotaxis protein CheD [Vicinamibacteria bacterium]